jgi:hypothetical protein
MERWDENWEQHIKPVVFDPAHAGKLAQLLRTARAPWDMADPGTRETTVEDALWYNVFATHDLREKLGGQPFENSARSYLGSEDDAALNAAVARFAADPAALEAIDRLLQTKGTLDVPLVTLHTLKDQQVGFGQELAYGQKLRTAGKMANRVLFPAFRYGHCNFRPWEALLSFAIVLYRTQGEIPEGMAALLTDPVERRAFENAAPRILSSRTATMPLTERRTRPSGR